MSTFPVGTLENNNIGGLFHLVLKRKPLHFLHASFKFGDSSKTSYSNDLLNM